MAAVFKVLAFSTCNDREMGNNHNLTDYISKQLTFAVGKADGILDRQDGRIAPRTLGEKGELIMVPSRDWVSGFFAGELWLMFGITGDSFWEDKARKYTSLLEQEKQNGGTHDMGFKMYCSYGRGYLLSGDESYREILIQSAETLITRYNEKVGCIRSWDHHRELWDYPVIIDNMMNLELLFWASKETGDPKYYDIAISHARNTIKNHYRKDNSSWHVLDYNPENGEVVSKVTFQGNSDESSWSRGQAWGLYGFTMAYRESLLPEFLDHAEKIADFIINHPRLPDDFVPYWDFDAPGIPDEPRDASAAAIIASALYELSRFSDNEEQYIKAADKIFESLSSEKYLLPLGSNSGFLLGHSTGSRPANAEVDIPLVYADYYFLEAFIRKNKFRINDSLLE